MISAVDQKKEKSEIPPYSLTSKLSRNTPNNHSIGNFVRFKFMFNKLCIVITFILKL